jgi:large subunit ribosomal protein L25
MSDTEKILAETRTEFGKGAARRIRRADKIPAVLYGHGNEPVHITLPGHATMLALRHGGANALLALQIDGTEQLALTKDVQIDPLRREIEHVDFVTVKRGQKVEVDVPVHVVGEAAPETLVTTEYPNIHVEAEATHIPEYLEVSVEGAEAGTQVLAKDLELPSGTTLLTEEDVLVVNVSQQMSEEDLEAELAEAEDEAGIVQEESDGEDAAAEAADGSGDDSGPSGEADDES